MLHQLPTLQKLVRHLQKVPYLASKNVYKVAAYFLEQEPQVLASFCKLLLEARDVIALCTVCFNWTEGSERCLICQNTARNQSVICVVEYWHDVTAMESAGGFKGVYHVLGGALCPLEGIGPDKIRIKELLNRLSLDVVQEVILATNQTPEGEATASYIANKIVEIKNVTVSRLASGIPTGSTLEYMDRITIAKALSGRRPF